MTVQQGHKYQSGKDIGIAVEVGERITWLREILPDAPWLGKRFAAGTDGLVPLPMKYFNGDAPK